MKHRFLILICLCLIMGNSTAFAQLFSTSSGSFHSYGGGGSYAPTPSSTTSSIRSTSSFSTATTISNYSTAPIHMANGTLQTAASTLSGGMLADETGFTTDAGDTGFIPISPQRPIAPPDVNVPLHFDWESFLLLLLLAATYAYKQYARIIKRKATKIVQVIRKKG